MTTATDVRADTAVYFQNNSGNTSIFIGGNADNWDNVTYAPCYETLTEIKPGTSIDGPIAWSSGTGAMAGYAYFTKKTDGSYQKVCNFSIVSVPAQTNKGQNPNPNEYVQNAEHPFSYSHVQIFDAPGIAPGTVQGGPRINPISGTKTSLEVNFNGS